jgi:hypothetical protein
MNSKRPSSRLGWSPHRADAALSSMPADTRAVGATKAHPLDQLSHFSELGERVSAM